MPTISGYTRRSFYPENVLIRRREIQPLWLKHRYGIARRMLDLLDFSHFLGENSSPDLELYEPHKKIGELLVSAPAATPASGYDRTHKVTINRYKQRVIGLHIDAIKGPGQIRQDMADAAAYIHNLPSSHSRPYVVGVTYAEMGLFAARLGFREMEISDLHLSYKADVAAAHAVFSQFGNRGERPCVPAMVYLPTEEFVQKYNPGLVDAR